MSKRGDFFFILDVETIRGSRESKMYSEFFSRELLSAAGAWDILFAKGYSREKRGSFSSVLELMKCVST